MINQILALFSGVESMLKMSLAIAIIIGIVFILIYIPQMRPVIGIVAVVAFVFLGGYTCYLNVKYFTAHSMTIGEVFETVFKKTEVEETDDTPNSTSWSFTTVAFRNQGGDIWQASITLTNNEVVDFENKDYIILVNDEECFVNENGGSISNPYIKSRFAYAFYKEDSSLILTDTLYINFAFSKLQTDVTITTYGGSQAKTLWDSYKAKNGLIISLKEAEKLEAKSITIHSNYVSYTLTDGTLGQAKVLNFANGEFEISNETSKEISSLTIPEGVERLTDTRFENLTYLSLPSTVSNICSLWQFSKLERVDISPENREYKIVNNCLTNFDCTEVYSVYGDYEIPSNVKINNGAFSYDANVIKIVGENVKLASSCVTNFENLITLYLPKQFVSFIDGLENDYFLVDCPNLHDIHYAGNKNQWQALIQNLRNKKYQDRIAKDIVVHCIDGECLYNKQLTALQMLDGNYKLQFNAVYYRPSNNFSSDENIHFEFRVYQNQIVGDNFAVYSSNDDILGYGYIEKVDDNVYDFHFLTENGESFGFTKDFCKLRIQFVSDLDNLNNNEYTYVNNNSDVIEMQRWYFYDVGLNDNWIFVNSVLFGVVKIDKLS